MREDFVADWAFGITGAIENAVRRHFPQDLMRWPLLRAFDAKGYELPEQHMVIVLKDRLSGIPSVLGHETFPYSDHPTLPPKVEEVERWQSYLRSKLDLRAEDAALVIPTRDSGEYGAPAHYALFSAEEKQFWNQQISYVVARQRAHLDDQSRGLSDRSLHVSEFEQRRALRRRFLRAAYDLGKKRMGRMVGLEEIAGEIGMDPNDDELTNIAMYHEERGYMRKQADGYAIVNITAAGVDEVENEEPAPQTWGGILHGSTTGTSDAAAEEWVPPAIRESLREFKEDHPDPAKVAFILMQFGKTEAHKKITEAIKDGLAAHGITGVRADDKEYNEDLFPNVQTYLHGCGLGVAVFERIEAEKFNPNVSLEVGYMFAMDKRVCLLKDQTLSTLQADLVGKLYREFDPQDPTNTIPPMLSAWLADRGLSTG